MKWQIGTIILVIGAILICGCTQQPAVVTPTPASGTKAPGTPATPVATVSKGTTSVPSVPSVEETLSPFDLTTAEASGYYEEALQLAFESWNSSGSMEWEKARGFLNQANDQLKKAKQTYQLASSSASTTEQKEFLNLKSQAIMNMEKSLETDGKVLDELMKENPDDNVIGQLSDESTNYYNTASNLYDRAEETLFVELPPATISQEMKALVGVTLNGS